MAVDAAQLEADLLAFFEDPPLPIPDCAADWATIMGDYAAPVVPASTAVAAAAATLETAIASALALPVAAPAMDAAFIAFAATIFGGMPPMSPPAPAVISWAAALAVPAATHAQGADNFATFLDTWFTSTGWT